MDNAKFAKLCRECKIAQKGVTSGMCDIAFTKSQTKGKRTLTFEQFSNALAVLGPQRFPKDEDPISKIERCVLHHASSGPMIRTAVVAADDATLGRLTDSSQYTGASAQRFDKDGRGRGLAGRDSISKSKGGVGDGVQDLSQITRSNLRGNTTLGASSVVSGTSRARGSPDTATKQVDLTDAQITQLFVKYDEDESGYLDVDEVGWLCEDLGLVLTDRQVEEALSEMEGGTVRARDGQVDMSEFLRWWRSDSGSKKAGSLARRLADAKVELLQKEMAADTPMGRMLAAKQAAGTKPTLSSARKESSVFDKLTDSKQYTGAHKSRFDATGKGTGLAGRDSVAVGKGAGVYQGGNVRVQPAAHIQIKPPPCFVCQTLSIDQ